MKIGRAKFVVENGRRANTRENHFSGSCYHVPLMPVISALGPILTPLVVLHGKKEKYRNRWNSKFEKPSDFLPKPNYLYMRPISGVDKSIFVVWATNFCSETPFLRRGGKKILMIFDGYGCHISYKALPSVKEKNMFVAGIPANTSHVLQPLDISVFGIP